jgi:hypothetical protein
VVAAAERPEEEPLSSEKGMTTANHTRVTKKQ